MAKSAKLVFAEHYTMKQLLSWADIAPLIASKREDADLNWLFLATSGVHGTYTPMDERETDDQSTTVLIVQPRLVCVLWGHLEIPKHADAAMRQWVKWTTEAVASQAVGNLPQS